MKKLVLTAAIILACLSLKVADAQRHLRASVNISSQPEWGPVGYKHVDYYYMPDADAYYDVHAHQYVYNENGSWVHGDALPSSYHFDKYHSYKVVVNQHDPWEHHTDISARYGNYKGRTDQNIIRDSRDKRYRNHWKGDRDNHDRNQ